jgi:asparagine synthase (glutamine-hydrolysing)
MCGIAGTFGFGHPALLKAMTDAIAHRGPDGEGFYHDGPVHLGSRRLAILDPQGGTQPMANEDGSIVVVYNGEIYNYPDLRRHLLAKGHVLRTGCDTEVLPHLYEDEGIDFVRRLNGIFAFALWDRRRQLLLLARDPIGVKPLVYAALDGRLAFGSEAKAVLASGLVRAELDPVSLHLTMNVRYIPGTDTLFTGIRRLGPGEILEMSVGKWSVREQVAIEWTPDPSLSEADWLAGIREHASEAVHRQLLSDVPVGICLSGGIDSSSLVAFVRQRHSGPLKTFTLGFGEPWDETGDARTVAQQFDTMHHELVLHEPALAHLKDAIHFAEEPKVNCLQLYLLHRFVGREVKVSLSGLGGDELFGGYDIYTYLQRLAPLRGGLPGWIASHGLGRMLASSAAGIASLERPSLDLYARGMEWLASIDDGCRHYLLLRNAWDSNRALVSRVYTREFAAALRTTVRERFEHLFPGNRPLEAETLLAEFRTKLVNDLLHNEDTMSMAHSVESRVPFLDLELVRYAARIPDDMRFRHGPKGLLKKALSPVLPAWTLDKRKWGFTFDPVEQYRKDLRTMALDVLSPERLRRDGIFQPSFVERVLRARPHQRLRWHYFMLWQMIGLHFWRELFLERASTDASRRWPAAASLAASPE